MNPIAIAALVLGALVLRSALRPLRWMRRPRRHLGFGRGFGRPWRLGGARWGLGPRVKLGLLAVAAVVAVDAWRRRSRH